MNINQNNINGNNNVNVFGETKINLSEEDKNKITDFIGNKNNPVHVSLQSGGSSNLTNLAQEVFSYLKKSGHTNLNGIHTIMGFSPFKGINLQKEGENFVVFVGSLQ
ncbi:MAG: hypothetical protein JWN37_347 [Candidatus Nomurabacteria bacterium]|nr:hypothetical protein [Candidatus Nomurabacteria bacterium]